MPPRLPVDARSRIPLQPEICCSPSLDVVGVVQERCEPLFAVPSCCLTYPLQRSGRARPALRPERVALSPVPLGRPPSLHRLLHRSPGFVRRLPRYYGAVRLPTSVHHRRASVNFPARPAAPPTADRRGTSRFPREVLACVPGVSDSAGSVRVSRWRCEQCGLPPISTASAPRSGPKSRSSIPGPHVPLSTLHPRPCGRWRMTRGRCGSLALHRTKLPFATPRRFCRRTEILWRRPVAYRPQRPRCGRGAHLSRRRTLLSLDMPLRRRPNGLPAA